MNLLDTLNNELSGDRVWVRWAVMLGSVTVAMAALIGVKRILHRRLASLAPKTETHLDDLLAQLVAKTSAWFLLALALLATGAVFEVPQPLHRIGRAMAFTVCLVQVGVWISWASKQVVERHFLARSTEADAAARQTGARVVSLGIQVVIWALLLLVALANFGVDITALVAGLGVGGVAVALATQNILGDVFASISILLDKPFVAGDFVVVGDFMGTVEHVGIKTTRVRSLGGEQIVFANNDLLQSRLRNYKRMNERRILFRLGVVYQTPAATLAAIPELLRGIIQSQPLARFDRAHFSSYGDFALTFEVVYYVLSADYNQYMDVQQAINLDIYRRFAAKGIEFAYPTQTLVVQRATPAKSVDGAA